LCSPHTCQIWPRFHIVMIFARLRFAGILPDHKTLFVGLATLGLGLGRVRALMSGSHSPQLLQ
ncbi:MAG: hypothetical protein ACRD6N_18885, partial [Pyrinomonadaceae bacterium]